MNRRGRGVHLGVGGELRSPPTPKCEVSHDNSQRTKEDQWAMSGIEVRIEKAAQSILENEKLTADLDDDAAQVLLDWGIASAKQIVQGTLGLDENEAQDAMYQPMRANRRLMRGVNKLVSRYEILGEEGHVEALEKIISQAGVIYGSEYVPPSLKQQGVFLSETKEMIADIPQWIAKLRKFVEGQKPSAPSSLFS